MDDATTHLWDDAATYLWNCFQARVDLPDDSQWRPCNALYSPFMIALASGELSPANMDLHVAGVLQIIGAIETLYTWAEKSIRSLDSIASLSYGYDIAELKSRLAEEYDSIIADALAAQETGAVKGYDSLSSRRSLFSQVKRDIHSLRNSPIKFCAFVVRKFGHESDGGLKYAAFLLAAASAFMKLSWFLADKLKKFSDPRYAWWIDRFASDKFFVDCKSTEWVFNQMFYEANFSIKSLGIGGADRALRSHYNIAMQLAMEFFASYVTVGVEECAIVPLTRELNPATDLILIGCGLDSSCCKYLESDDFRSHVRSSMPIVQVEYMHDNVISGLQQVPGFQEHTSGLDIDTIETIGGLEDLLLTIGSSENFCNANVHVLASLYKHYDQRMKSLISGYQDKCTLHENCVPRHDTFRSILRNHANKKLFSIYVGTCIDDLGCLLEADIGFVLNPCDEFRFYSTQFGVTLLPFLKALVLKQKQMNTLIRYLWKPKAGTLYVINSWDEVIAFVCGVVCAPNTTSTGGESSSQGRRAGLFTELPETKFKKGKPPLPETKFKNIKPPSPLFLPEPKNHNLTEDSIKVEKWELKKQHAEKRNPEVVKALSKKDELLPKNLDLNVDSSNVGKRDTRAEKHDARIPDVQTFLALLPKPKNLYFPVDTRNVEKLETQAKQCDANQKVEEEEQVPEDGNRCEPEDEQFEKDEDED